MNANDNQTEVHALDRGSVLKILDRYGLLKELRYVGDDLVGRCPIHKGIFEVFAISPNSDKWRCNGSCYEGGNSVKLVARLEKLSLEKARRLVNSLLTGNQ